MIRTAVFNIFCLITVFDLQCKSTRIDIDKIWISYADNAIEICTKKENKEKEPLI